jgi:hypothetical protein
MHGNKVRQVLILVLASLMGLILFAVGCTGEGNDSAAETTNAAILQANTAVVRQAEATNQAMGEPVITREPPTPVGDIPAQRLIIRNASLELIVQDAEAVSEQINALVEELDGYVVSLQLTQYDEDVRVHMTVRVPAESLTTALTQLRDMALEVRRQNLSGEDVTQEYVDLQSRLRHMEATEARLLTFLEQAEDTEATLAVYTELRRIQEEIERIKGRSQYLEQSSALSNIDIALIPESAPQPVEETGWRPQGALGDALDALVRTLQFLADAFVWLLVYVLPVFVLPALVLLWLVRRWFRRWRRSPKPIQTEKER